MFCVLGGLRRAASVSKLALFGLAGAAALLAAGVARAEDTGIPDPSIATSLPPGLADPGGVRAAWASRGVLFGVNYIGEVFGTASGGFENRAYYDGRLEVVVSADLERMLGWKGLSFFANGYQIHGESITGESLGALMPVSFIEATPATRLFELWFEQRLLDDKLSIRFGQIAADSEFMLSDGGGAFINGTWGWPSITAANLPNGGPAYPLATPGVRVAFTPNDQLTLMAAVFNGDPAGTCAQSDDPQVCNEHGVSFRVSDPALTMFEGGYRYSLGGLPGTVKLGGWHQEGEVEDLLDTTIVSDSTYGLYAILDQMIYRLAEGRGISFFGRVIGAPEDRSFVDIYWEAGFTAAGMLPSRPGDVLGIGFAYTGISDDARAAQVAADPNQQVRLDYEALLEVSYIAEIVPGFTIQPDFQYFWNPGGNVPLDEADPASPAVKDAAVFGVRSTINY
jgi:porin